MIASHSQIDCRRAAIRRWFRSAIDRRPLTHWGAWDLARLLDLDAGDVSTVLGPEGERVRWLTPADLADPGERPEHPGGPPPEPGQILDAGGGVCGYPKPRRNMPEVPVVRPVATHAVRAIRPPTAFTPTPTNGVRIEATPGEPPSPGASPPARPRPSRRAPKVDPRQLTMWDEWDTKGE